MINLMILTRMPINYFTYYKKFYGVAAILFALYYTTYGATNSIAAIDEMCELTTIYSIDSLRLLNLLTCNRKEKHTF